LLVTSIAINAGRRSGKEGVFLAAYEVIATLTQLELVNKATRAHTHCERTKAAQCDVFAKSDRPAEGQQSDYSHCHLSD